MYDDSLCEQGRNFCNKIWNSFRLLKGWDVDEHAACPESSRLAVEWFESSLGRAMAEMEDLMGKIPYFGGPDDSLPPFLGRVLKLVPRGDKARLRHSDRRW